MNIRYNVVLVEEEVEMIQTQRIVKLQHTS